ncbi:hypothetical protein [Streptomyces sp. NPDC006879]|uniref:hypothetical protein n=1 Tax=Streptomyces sp. NPDC006879 TaxID=3364767 RepID=UPI0036B37A82
MNIRSLTRGDGVVIGAAVMLFIASFLDFYSRDCSGASAVVCDAEDLSSAWDTAGLGIVLPAVVLTGLIAATLIIVGRLQPEGRKFAGLSLAQWGSALALAAFWNSLWSLMTGPETDGPGIGAVLAFLATGALAGSAVFGSRVPGLGAPLLPTPTPQVAQPYSGQGGHGYGYPGAQQPAGQQPFDSGLQHNQGSASPQPHQQQGGAPYGQQAAHDQPEPAGQHGAPGAHAPAAGFAAFWFAVPVARPLFAEDGSPTPIAELAPGTWYLAVDQYGQSALVAQTQDGRRGVLQDTSGIQRG